MEAVRIRVGMFNAQTGIATTRGYWHYVATAWKYRLPHHSEPLRRFSDVVKREAIDILGLVEIDAGSGRTKQVDQLRLISEHTALPHRVFFPTSVRRSAHQGNAIVSRFPIVSWQNHKLPGLGEPRYLGQAEIRMSGETISFFTTHLSLSEMSRARQIRAITEIIGESEHPTILTGDFNISDHAEVAIIGALGFCRVTSGPTYPSWKPARYLDHIFVRGEFQVRATQVHPGKFSDHLLSVAEVTLCGGSPRTETLRGTCAESVPDSLRLTAA